MVTAFTRQINVKTFVMKSNEGDHKECGHVFKKNTKGTEKQGLLVTLDLSIYRQSNLLFDQKIKWLAMHTNVYVN